MQSLVPLRQCYLNLTCPKLPPAELSMAALQLKPAMSIVAYSSVLQMNAKASYAVMAMSLHTTIYS